METNRVDLKYETILLLHLFRDKGIFSKVNENKVILPDYLNANWIYLKAM